MEDQAPYKNLIAAMKEQAENDERFLERACETLDELNLYNSLYADLVVELAEDLTSFALTSGEEPESEMELDEEYGKGINLYRIIGALNEYDETDDTECLDEALAFIMREKERRVLCQL